MDARSRTHDQTGAIEIEFVDGGSRYLPFVNMPNGWKFDSRGNLRVSNANDTTTTYPIQQIRSYTIIPNKELPSEGGE